MPQVHILLVIWAIGSGSSCNPVDGYDPLFMTTFATSVMTASFGISKFLKSGPCHIIRNDSHLMGFGTLSYILLLTNIIITLVGKGLIFPLYLYGPGQKGLILVVMTLNFIPQFLHVSLLCPLKRDYVSDGIF